MTWKRSAAADLHHSCASVAIPHPCRPPSRASPRSTMTKTLNWETWFPIYKAYIPSGNNYGRQICSKLAGAAEDLIIISEGRRL